MVQSKYPKISTTVKISKFRIYIFVPLSEIWHGHPGPGPHGVSLSVLPWQLVRLVLPSGLSHQLPLTLVPRLTLRDRRLQRERRLPREVTTGHMTGLDI